MKNKKIMILTVLVIATLVVSITGATFAYFGAQGDTNKNVNINVETATTDILKFSAGAALSIEASQSNFGKGEASLSDETTATATLTANNSTNAVTEHYYLYLSIEHNGFDHTINNTTPELVLTVTGPDGEEVTSIAGLTYYESVTDNQNKTISGFDVTSTSGLVAIADYKEITAGSANGKDTTFNEEWTVKLTFVNYNADQTDNAGAGLTAKVLIQKVPAIADKILLAEANTNSINTARTFIQSKTTPSFSTNATTDEGIFATTDEDGTVYYFRGAVDDNHVIFGGFCWRIVRTTGTGGVKILYDGVPSNGTCNNTGSATTIGNYQFNTKYISPAYVGYMYGETTTSYSKNMTTLTEPIVFGNSVTYDKTTNTYTLVDTYTITDPSDWENVYTNVVKKHYTCFSSSNTCESVNYVNAIYSENKYCYYVTLSKGETHLDVLEKTIDNVENKTDSNIKSKIDSWFSTNLSNVAQYLEDTVFCNDREYYSLGGWNKDNSNYNGWLYFKSHQRLSNKKPSLSCSRVIDKFTVSSDIGNGDLTYPVGLITADEMAFAGGVKWQKNASYYLYNGVYSWSLSPYNFNNWNANVFDLNDSGNFSNNNVTNSNGARPLFSIKFGKIYNNYLLW